MVRRLIAYLTLGIFLLNVLGYYGVFVGARKLSGDILDKRLNTEMHDLGGNLTVKIPLAVPFEVTSSHFDRNDGQFEMDGETYHIIKQRHYNDTLYVVCIKDENTTRINSIFADYIQSFAGQDDGDAQQAVPGLFKDFVTEKIALTTSDNGWEIDLELSPQSFGLFDAYSATIVHPPNV